MIKDVKLQNIVLPMDADANFTYYPAMFIKGRSATDIVPISYNAEKKCHVLPKYGIGDFITYFNILQSGRWMKYTGVEDFSVTFEMTGKASIEIYEVYQNSENVNLNLTKLEIIESREKKFVTVNIPHTDKNLIGFRLTAIEDTEIYSGFYSAKIDDSQIRDVNISLATTTFKKQPYIKRNIALLKEKVLCEGSDLKGHLFVHVIDNERGLNPEEYNCEDLRVYPNDNVGGAGGFTRGMIEALSLDKRPTHVLLMDDDVMIMPESLFRTLYLLRIIKPEYRKCFLSGAMFDYDARQIQYEDVGYVHKQDGSYGPMKPKLDMQNLGDIVTNEKFIDTEIDDSYAGWWYCCIPVEHILERGLPLPVFVRGDDVEYSLRNKPGFVSLNGISIWHVGFAGKFNASMELYQVHRNSFIIQAASDICENVDFIKRVKDQFWKEITRFAYNNAELLLDSIDDYMKGPEFLEELNGEKSLKEHSAKNEKLVPLASLDYPVAQNEDPYSYVHLGFLKKVLYLITINGHLLPNFMLKKRPSVIAFDWFFVPGKNYRRKTLIAVNGRDKTGCVRTINRKRCFSLISRYNKTMSNYKKNHEKVNEQYRKHFAKMTTVDFWKEYLDI